MCHGPTCTIEDTIRVGSVESSSVITDEVIGKCEWRETPDACPLLAVSNVQAAWGATGGDQMLLIPDLMSCLSNEF